MAIITNIEGNAEAIGGRNDSELEAEGKPERLLGSPSFGYGKSRVKGGARRARYTWPSWAISLARMLEKYTTVGEIYKIFNTICDKSEILRPEESSANFTVSSHNTNSSVAHLIIRRSCISGTNHYDNILTTFSESLHSFEMRTDGMGGALALGIALWRMSYLQGSRFNDATLIRPKGLLSDFDPTPVAYSRRLLFDAMIHCDELGRMPSGTEGEVYMISVLLLEDGHVAGRKLGSYRPHWHLKECHGWPTL
ncbi:hypothetical protein WN51_09459 [Melipona quadrifasciata]|uniref:Uncharacterized protein n=1 Tax=Melipona quadrifasciata TaxID=166423 RepID=A0A0N0BBG6_9HYME|nr:hypothetical protein WN51_09459 [Melipona quadrifasciata]